MIINCDNNLLVGDTNILRSDKSPTIKILAKNNFITKSKLIKKKKNIIRKYFRQLEVCFEMMYIFDVYLRYNFLEYGIYYKI